MKESLEMQQNLTQTQTLAPLQVQYVKLLEMNTAAIEDEVQRRLDENPALEVVETTPYAEAESADSEAFSESAEDLQRADYGSDDEVPTHSDRPLRSQQASNPDDRRRLLENDPDEQDMSERLLAQLSENPSLDPRTEAFAQYIVGNLDSNGRLTRSLSAIADDIAIATGLDVSTEDLRPAFEAVRGLDPAGVGAIDLRDCLLLQLDRRKTSEAVSLARLIVDKYFDLLAVRRRDKLLTRTGTTSKPQLLDEALRVIHSLNPKPGNSDSGTSSADRAMHIVADFTVEPDPSDPEEHRLLVSLSQRIPELTVADWTDSEGSEVTTAEGAALAKHQAARAFMRSRMQEAQDFISILGRRTETLLKVMRAIVRVQGDFFRSGDLSSIRPMILKDIAEDVNRDISVVSRATAGKYVATPFGTFPLKMFFNERPSDESDASAFQVTEAIKTIIAEEDKRSPLSDDAIAEMLQKRGMVISRRTVTKYREQHAIPNSRGRRSLSSDSTQ